MYKFDFNQPIKFKKEKGQYITPDNIAKFIVGLINISKSNIKILDPGAGSGKLSLMLLDKILKNVSVNNIQIDLYENDTSIIDTLKNNIKIQQKKYSKRKIKFTIIPKNYIVSNTNIWNSNNIEQYDIILGNPPYKKIDKNSPESNILSSIICGQPNLYMLFLALSIKSLKNNGELVYILPRSFFSGKYFKKFREWLFTNCYISHIHSFKSRNKLFNNEILQELIIVKIKKIKISKIKISNSIDESDLEKSSHMIVNRNIIWALNSSEKYIRLPLTNNDIQTIDFFDKLDCKINDFGVSFSTGKIVDFRSKPYLSDSPKNNYPLIWSCNFGDTHIKWPLKNSKFYQYIANDENVKLMNNGNYILIKRISSQGEDKRLKINIILKNIFKSKYFGIENHINYIYFSDQNISFMKFIYILLNSKVYNSYFNIINGTNQVNAIDLNNLPCYNLNKIELSFYDKYKFEELDPDTCDNIIKSINQKL